MSSHASWIFVGFVFLVGLMARSANSKRFPIERTILALGAVGVGFALMYDYVSVQTAFGAWGALVLLAFVLG